MNSGTRQPQRDTAQQENQQTVGDQQTETVRAYVGSYHWGYFILDADGTELDQLTLSSGDELRLTLFNVEADDAIDTLPQAVRTNIPSPENRAQRNEQAIPVPQGTSLENLHDAAETVYPDHSLAILSDEYMWSRPDGSGRGPGSGGPGGPWGGHHGPHRGPQWPGGAPSGSGRGGQGPGQGPDSPYGPGMPWCDPGMMPGYGPGMMPGYGPGTMPGYGPGMRGSGWGSGSGGTLAPPVNLWHHSTVTNELGFVVNTAGSFGFVCTVYCGYGHPYMAERSRVVVNEN